MSSPLVQALLVALAALALLLVNGAVLVVMLRRTLSRLHIGLGPTRVGQLGMLRTLADFAKLLIEEDRTFPAADRWLFRLAPVLVFVPSLMACLPLAFSQTLRFADLDTGLLLGFAFASLVPLWVMMAGWPSGSKRSLMGSVRAVGQQIAYDVPLLLSLLGPVMWAGSMNMTDIVLSQRGLAYGFLPRWYFAPQFVALVIYVIAAQAGTIQRPSAAPEADSQLTSGIGNEHAGTRVALMLLAEYSRMLLLSAVGVTLFFGGWLVPWADQAQWAAPVAPAVFMLKTYVGIFAMLWIRGALPRVRTDQMLAFAWKVLVPASLVWVVASAIVLKAVRP